MRSTRSGERVGHEDEILESTSKRSIRRLYSCREEGANLIDRGTKQSYEIA